MDRSLNQRRPGSRTTGDVTISVIRALVASIAFVLVLCSPGRAADSAGSQPITLNFSVLDEKNQPLADALVQLRLNGQLLASTPTDDHGKGSITVLSAGTYIFNVSKKGYIKTDGRLQISADAGAEEVDVILAEAALSQQNIEVQGTVSNPLSEASSSQATLNPIQAKDAPSRPATLTDALPLVPGIVRGKDGSVRIAGYGENHSAFPCGVAITPQFLEVPPHTEANRARRFDG